jgi:colanic acid/amylovoran biosynthesis protein
MRILIHAGSYYWGNVGDVAMLQAGVERLRTLWPQASIAAVTRTAEALSLCCPGVDPITFAGHAAFFSHRFFGRFDQWLPGRIREMLTHGEQRLRRRWPASMGSFIAVKRAFAGRRDYVAPLRYVRALRQADLVLATGGGIFTDSFTENALAVLNTLEFAIDQGRPTALMGQGVGPVSSEALRRRMAEVLPRVDLIAVRERIESVRLLQSLGVSPDRIAVTGDDAIEMANRGSTAELGHAIGVNVRLTNYAGTDRSALSTIRAAVQTVSNRLAAPLVPLPIAQHPDSHDGVAIAELLPERTSAPDLLRVRTPREIIEAVAQCRVVVTGSYHGAVFALAQGIPVVAIAASPYYLHKFGGLGELFPEGCDLVRLQEPDAGRTLEMSIECAWRRAPVVRRRLLEAAESQIVLGRKAYARLRSLDLGRRTERRQRQPRNPLGRAAAGPR